MDTPPAGQRVHLIGQAHIDPAWLWELPEGRAEVRATFASAVARAGEYPGFVFTANQIVFCDWVQRADPNLWKQVVELAHEGRFQLVGGWWSEPDVNACGGEPMLRQALLGQRWLARNVGYISTVGLAEDSFGHPASLPSTLVAAGMDCFVFSRPGPAEATLPWAFRWAAPDGSTVVAYRIPDGYNSGPGPLGDHLDRARAEMPSGAPDVAVFYGVGNHGGGPTRATLDDIDGAALSDGLVCSSLQAFVDCLDPASLPVVTGDLHHHASGCYAADRAVKSWHRRAVAGLLAAERLSALATSSCGAVYPTARLHACWERLALHEFHDLLAGTSVPSARDRACDALAGIIDAGEESCDDAVQSLAAHVAVPYVGGTQPVLVVNPVAVPVRDVVELTVPAVVRGPVAVVDDASGAVLPAQPVAPPCRLANVRDRLAVSVPVNPLGWRLLRVIPAASVRAPDTVRPGATRLEAASPVHGDSRDGTVWSDNGIVRIGVDDRSGEVRWLSGPDGVNLAAAASVLGVEDTSDTWGHGVLRFDGHATRFTAVPVRPSHGRREGVVSVVETGPVRRRLQVAFVQGDDRVELDYSLAAGDDAVRVSARVTAARPHRAVVWRLATHAHDAKAWWDCGYGAVVRPADGCECPLLGWVDMRDPTTGTGVAVVSVDVTSASVHAGVLSLTLARTAAAAHHDPSPATRGPEDPGGPWLDIGVTTSSFLLRPGGGDAPRRPNDHARLAALAASGPAPLRVLPEGAHPGRLPAVGRGVTVSPEASSAMVAVVKAGEDDQPGARVLAVRVAETAGRREDAEVRVLGTGWHVSLAPWQVRTFTLTWLDGGCRVEETSALEWTPERTPPGQPVPMPSRPTPDAGIRG